MTDREKEDDDADLARLEHLLDCYGATPERWPAAERPWAEAYLERSQRGWAALEAARELDRMLDGASPPEASPEFMAEVLEAMDPSPFRRSLRTFWPVGAFWKPASALACAGVLGLIVGMSGPGAEPPGALDRAVMSVFSPGPGWGDLQ